MASGEIRNRASQREPNIVIIVIVVIRSVVIVNFVSASSQTLNKDREWNFDGAQEKMYYIKERINHIETYLDNQKKGKKYGEERGIRERERETFELCGEQRIFL